MPRFQVYSLTMITSGLEHFLVRLGQQEDVSSLVEVTRDMVKDQVKGDAWVMWAIAQRASLPVKLNACIE